MIEHHEKNRSMRVPGLIYWREIPVEKRFKHPNNGNSKEIKPK